MTTPSASSSSAAIHSRDVCVPFVCNKLGDDLGYNISKETKRAEGVRVSYLSNPNCGDFQFSIQKRKGGKERL
jgi:hypothetical protein